jgi:hypothetical protein
MCVITKLENKVARILCLLPVLGFTNVFGPTNQPTSQNLRIERSQKAEHYYLLYVLRSLGVSLSWLPQLKVYEEVLHTDLNVELFAYIL